MIVGVNESQLEIAGAPIESDEDHRARAQVLNALCVANGVQTPEATQRILPSATAIAEVLRDFQAILYPSLIGKANPFYASLKQRLTARLDKAQAALREQIRRGLEFGCRHRAGREGGVPCTACAARAAGASRHIIARLPRLRSILDSDIQAAFDGDPSAASVEEVLCCSPGFRAILCHRIAHDLHLLSVPLIPRIMSEVARAATGIDIHPGATIDSSFFIDHGVGVVIGETARIGKRVRLYQGVTLGARTFPVDREGRLIKGLIRHPIVEDDVTIYAGATILGRITIGRGARIACNVCVTRSVPPETVITRDEVCPDKPKCG